MAAYSGICRTIALQRRDLAGVIQSTKLSSDYSKKSIVFVYAHRNMVHKRQLSVNDNTQVYFFSETKNWC